MSLGDIAVPVANMPSVDANGNDALALKMRLAMISCGRLGKMPGFLALARLFLIASLLAASVCYGQVSGDATETRVQPSKLPPCPTSESERNQVSPLYFNLCAGVHLPKSDAPTEADGKPVFPPRPDYIPKELPPCPTWNPNALVSPYYPCPGQKLGLPKDEAEAALPPEIRELLDTLLRMYREPGLFTDRRQVLALLGVKQVSRHWASRSTNMPAEEPSHFTDTFAKEGLFARPGWSGSYGYHGWSDKGKSWYVNLIIRVDHHVECINSRAVEGYLDLFLQTGLKGRIHPVPPERWYRHGVYGGPYALALGPLTPNFGMGFGNGCLTDLVIYRAFEYQHAGDENGIAE